MGNQKPVKTRRIDNTMAKKQRDKRTNNDLQNTTEKTKDYATRNPIKTGDRDF